MPFGIEMMIFLMMTRNDVYLAYICSVKFKV